MLIFGIGFVLYFFELSEKSGFWKTETIRSVGEGREGGSSHDVEIIIGGGLLILDDKGRRGFKNLGKSDYVI